MMKFRRGLSSASSSERLLIYHAEHKARTTATQEWYEARCVSRASIMCDARDLAARYCVTQWARHGGSLYLILRVVSADGRQSRVFRWRTSMQRPAGRPIFTAPTVNRKREG